MSPTFRADLHCHTTCSDGSLTPIELVQLAKEISLQGLSITVRRHTVLGYFLAKERAKELGIELIPGVELSSRHNNQNVHILGYCMKPDHPGLQLYAIGIKNRRIERCQAMLDQLKRLGLPLSFDEVAEQSQSELIGRPHIAAAMVKKGLSKSVREAFRLYLGDGKPGYVPGASVSVEETIQTIHAAEGVAIIAHPHLIQSRSLFRLSSCDAL